VVIIGNSREVKSGIKPSGLDWDGALDAELEDEGVGDCFKVFIIEEKNGDITTEADVEGLGIVLSAGLGVGVGVEAGLLNRFLNQSNPFPFL
jgi:hypothetical protein